MRANIARQAERAKPLTAEQPTRIEDIIKVHAANDRIWRIPAQVAFWPNAVILGPSPPA
ncbi:hypothetical protein [Agrobacterium rosae]|uniref:hypothetical protein n=1 Tax=Agrobacterium rosae TaxID=1972867 RepID=UPI00129672A4|nr:hypothetical protein [Agrobacterium rosae]